MLFSTTQAPVCLLGARGGPPLPGGRGVTLSGVADAEGSGPRVTPVAALPQRGHRTSSSERGFRPGGTGAVRKTSSHARLSSSCDTAGYFPGSPRISCICSVFTRHLFRKRTSTAGNSACVRRARAEWGGFLKQHWKRKFQPKFGLAFLPQAPFPRKISSSAPPSLPDPQIFQLWAVRSQASLFHLYCLWPYPPCSSPLPWRLSVALRIKSKWLAKATGLCWTSSSDPWALCSPHSP